MLASLLALGASAAWGTADFLAGLKAKALPLLTVALGSQLTGLAVLGAIALAAGGRSPTAAVLWGVPGGVCGAIGLLALYRGLAVGSMAVVAPISATSAVVPVVFGLARGERPTSLQGIGIAVALVGVILASQEPSHGGGRRTAIGVELGLVAAVGIGFALVFLDAAGRGNDPVWAVIALRTGGAATLAATALVLRPSLRTGRRDLAAVLLVGLFDTTGNVAFVVATGRGLLSVVAVLGSLYPVVTAFLARVVLAERVSRLQLLGSAGALLGVALITAG